MTKSKPIQIHLPERNREDVDFEWLACRMMERPTPPAGERGGVRLTIETVPAGKQQMVVSLRNSIFMGCPPTQAAFDEDLEIRHLGYEGGEWMADTPQEVWQMYEPLEMLCSYDEPSILIGGLGLGCFTHLATEYSGAIATTVEKDERVISLVAAHAARRVIHADIYEFCRNIEPGEYDVAFLDTWQSTGENCWNREVVPLRRILGDKVPKVYCWNEDEMVGQIFLSAMRAMILPIKRIPPGSTHWRVLRRRAGQLGYDAVPDVGMDDMMDSVLKESARLHADNGAHALLSRFVADPGCGAWEEEFGALWDEAEAEHAEWRDKHGFES